MKKLFVSLTTLALLTMSLVAVSAAEPVEETSEASVTTNMDAATYLELRLSQLDTALTNGDITQEQYDLLRAHIEENAEEGIFGRGPQGYNSSNYEDCVLGEDGQLGIFRNATSGTRSGQGNGVGTRSADGSASGNRATKGNGGRGNSGSNGMRLQDGSAGNDDCILN